MAMFDVEQYADRIEGLMNWVDWKSGTGDFGFETSWGRRGGGGSGSGGHGALSQKLAAPELAAIAAEYARQRATVEAGDLSEGEVIDENKSSVGTSTTVYVENNSDYVIYFKPEETMIIDGITYDGSGAYPLAPGEKWNYPVDGIKIWLPEDYPNQVIKVPGKYGYYSNVTIENGFRVDIDFYGFGEFYNGWTTTLPDNGWLNLWNSQPYKP